MGSIFFKSVAAFLYITPILAGLDRPTLFSDGLSPHVDAKLWVNLKPTPSIQEQWEHGMIPERCLEEIENAKPKLDASDVEVFNVTYTDCGIGAWVFCRHKDAQLSQIDMIDLFGRLPVRERQWLQHIIAVPASGPSAYTVNKVTVYQGAVGTPSVFQHETAHALDNEKTAPNDSDGESSATSEWKDAISTDTCVSDDYANSSNAEDYAQVSVLTLFDIVVPGGLASMGDKWLCLRNQVQVFMNFQGFNVHPGGTCDRRWDDSAVVPMNSTSDDRAGRRTAERIKSVADGKDERGTLSNGRMGLPTDSRDRQVEVHRYENLVFNKGERDAAMRRQKRWNVELKAKRAKVF